MKANKAKESKVVGNFILDEWINGDFREAWLRRINRETKTTYVSDVQRDVKNWKVDPKKYEYRHVGKWTRRYRKTKDGGFKSVTTRLSNPDGKSNLSLVTDLKTVKCKFTFDELFNTDIRQLQDAKSYPLNQLITHGETRPERFLLRNSCYLSSPNEGWDAPIAKYLMEQFGVPVYRLTEFLSEFFHQGNITRAATYMQITHFGGEKKSLTREENEFNHTILFWLFDDKLIFRIEEGKDSH